MRMPAGRTAWRCSVTAGLALALGAPAGAHGQPAGKPAPKPPPPTGPGAADAWQTWLIRVEYIDRQDPVGEDAANIKALQEKAAAEQRADARQRLERRVAQARTEAAKRAGFVIYGWSVHADGAGKPVDQNRAMSGFLVPYSDEHARLLRSPREGSLVTVERAASDELFTSGGRRYVRAARAARAMQENEWRDPPPPQAPDAFPSRMALQKSPAMLKELWKTSLNFVRTEERDNGAQLTRFMVDIEEKQAAPPGRDKNPGPPLRLWVHIRAARPDGAVIGPILERIDVPRSEAGVYRISRSLELITPKGAPKLDPRSVSVEPIAMQ